jgi:hypothetical protein
MGRGWYVIGSNPYNGNPLGISFHRTKRLADKEAAEIRRKGFNAEVRRKTKADEESDAEGDVRRE